MRSLPPPALPAAARAKSAFRSTSEGAPPELLVLMPKPGQLTALGSRQTGNRLLPAALVSVSLGDPRANEVAARLQTRGQGLRPAQTSLTIWRRNSNTVGVFLGIGGTSGKSFRVSTKPGQSQLCGHRDDAAALALLEVGRSSHR